MAYPLLKSLHILFIITWLGTDLAVFYSSTFLLDRRLPKELRSHAGRIAATLDMVPRVSLLMTISLAFTLAYIAWGLKTALGSMAVPTLVFTWIACIGWAGVLVDAFLRHKRLARVQANEEPGQRRYLACVRQADIYLRVLLLLGVLVFAGFVVVGQSPLSRTWQDWKVILMAVPFAGGIALRLPPTNFAAPLGNIVRNGSTPAEEAKLRRTVLTAYPFVWAIWASVVAAIFVAVFKP